MTLKTYTNLIKNLPYLDQAFETRKANWKRQCEVNERFYQYCHIEFKGGTIKLSRQDLFDRSKDDFFKAIVSIIFWGYPKNMRGSLFTQILNSVPTLQKALPVYKDLNEEQFLEICVKTKKTGVGLSTLTKILYFFEYNIDHHRCLIFDKRIIDVINDEQGFTELETLTKAGKITEFNKRNKYVAYLQLMEDLSHENKYDADKLELFLFSMGKNLKPSN